MEGKTLSHFRILEKIGKGGMGVVYRAEDIRLGRVVAIKVLPPHLVEDENRRARFVTEARTTAAVTHPNIATIYEIDEVDGTIFIAMEYFEGETLRDRIHGQGLPVKEAVDHAAEIAEGLAAAHQANIVHRDLKPENIMITKDGHPKILDFGLARLLEEPQSGDAGDTLVTPPSTALTEKQSILGTPTYMSPEQARGRDLDFRSDIFSFGSTFYEMLTGRAPFQAASSADTISDLLNNQPVPVASINPDVPSEVQWILDKCLEKSAEERYQDTRDLVVDLRHLVRDSLSTSRPSGAISAPPLPSQASSPFSGELMASQTSVQQSGVASRRSRAWPAFLLAGVAVAVLAFFGLQRLFEADRAVAPDAEENSLAIFAFENLVDPDDPQRYGQIFQDLLITSLSDLEPLRVYSGQRLFDIQKQLSRTRERTFDKEFATEAARQAGAQHMLTGSLGQLGDKWILTCQLMQVDDGTVVFSKRIDGDDLYAIADDLTSQLQDDMRIAAPTELSRRISLRDKTSSSMDAYKHYMDGQDLLNAGAYHEAADAFQRAVEIDPEFAQAYTKLAVAIWWPRDNPRAALETLGDALERNLYTTEKEKLLAEAYLDQMHERFSDALPKFEQLASEYPDDKEVWYGLGESLFHFPGETRRDEASVAFEKAVALDPDFLLPYKHIFDRMWENRSFDDAIQRAEALVRRDPEKALWHRYRAEARAYTAPEEEIDAILADALEHQRTAADQRELYKGVATRIAHRGLFAKLEEYLEKALEVDPEHDDLTIVRGLMDLLRSQAKWDELEQRVDLLLEEDPLNTVVMGDLFSVYNAKRRYRQAEQDARRLTQEFSDDPQWSRRWVRYAVLSGDPETIDAAVAAAEQAVRNTDDRMRLLGTLGWAYDDRGDHNRAIEYFRNQATVEPDQEFPFIYQALGWQELARGRWDASRSWFSRALEVNPSEMGAIHGLYQVSREAMDA
ncbi:MAG: protein kinase, partial [Candidatus Latescibacterota bacterium]